MRQCCIMRVVGMNTKAAMVKKVAIFPMVFQFFKVIPAFEWSRLLFKLCPNQLTSQSRFLLDEEALN